MIASFLLSVLASLNAGVPFEVPPRVLQPTEYTSPSGEFTLFVDPTNRLGEGPGKYTMSRNGVEVWSGVQPFTLCRAAVTDDGWVAGYGYTNGLRDLGARGAFQVASFSPDGALVLNDSTPRERSRFLHTAPDPVALGLALDPSSDRFIVRVLDPDLNSRCEDWWTYRMATPERLDVISPSKPENPRGDRGLRILDVRSLDGAPFHLVWWWYVDIEDYSMGYFEQGGVFSLVNQDGEEIWSLSLLDDYTVRGDKEAHNAQKERVREHGAILDVGPHGRFSIWNVADGKRLDYQILERPDMPGGEVVTVGASDYEPPPSTAVSRTEEYPLIELEPVASIPLGRKVTPVGGTGPISHFGFDEGGRFRVVRQGEDGAYSVAIVTREGDVEGEVAIEPIETDAVLFPLAWWPLVDGRWLVTKTWYRAGGEPSVWFADERTGEVTRLPSEWPCTFESVSAVPDGGFIALVSFQSRYSSRSAMYRVDDAGKVAWDVDLDHHEEPRLYSPEAAAVTPQGNVVVLDNTNDTIHWFDLDGAHERVMGLEDMLPTAPRYPTGITTDPCGAIMLHDSQASYPLQRINEEGEVTSSIRIESLEGRPIGRMHDLARAAPDGSIWTTDGDALHRVDENGSIDRTIGKMPSLEELSAMGATCIDSLGRILILDRKTSVLHAFDKTGRRLFFVKVPSASAAKIFVDPDGTIFIRSGLFGGRCFQVACDGSSVANAVLGSREVAFCPDGSRWLLNSPLSDEVGIRRVKESEVLADVQRTSDGRWFGWIRDFVTDARGGLIVCNARPSMGGGSRLDHTPGIAVYGPDGSPESWIPVSGRRLAASDKWVAVASDGGRFSLIRRADKVVFTFTPLIPTERERREFGFSPEGDEFWIVGSRGPTLHKFALP